MKNKKQQEPPVEFYPCWNLDDVVTIPGLRKWRYGPGGSLTTNLPIPGVTQFLKKDCSRFYGYSHFVGESIRLDAAQSLANLLSNEIIDIELYDNIKALSV